MKIHFGVVALVSGVLLGSLATSPALAQGRGRGQGQGQSQGQGDQGKAKGDATKQQPAATVQFIFNDHDRDLVLKHYNPKSGLPPGLAKRDGDLPPGLEKQLRRNGTLPPGLQKKIQPFPRTLLDQLRPLPTGYRYGVADGHVVIYRPDTFVIADIILHVIR